MAYLNVKPPALPDYDSEVFGFYLLVFNYELGAENWYMVHLTYGAWRFQYEEGVGITNTGTTFTRTYSDGVWSEETQNTEALALNPGLTGNVYQRIYTNENIFAGDDLWLAANTVTPLDEEQRFINMKSQAAGFIAAWCSPPRAFPKREPVAWETLWDSKVESVLGGQYNGCQGWLWGTTEDGTNALAAGDIVRVTVDGSVCNLTVQDMPDYTGFVEAGNKWLYAYEDDTTYTDDGTDIYFWEYRGGLRFYMRNYGTPHVKFERAIS